MKIQLLAVGQKMPTWVNEGFLTYQKRFPTEMPLILKEIPAEKRLKNTDTARILNKEGRAMLDCVDKSHRLITLDERGHNWSTKQLANQLETWQLDGRDVSILIGGPEGLAPQCKAQAEQSWALSALTLPHPMVRIMMAEALYRAWTLTIGHPYHRE